MNRSLAEALVATAQVAVVALGVPLWSFNRLTDSLLPPQLTDLALLAAVLCWCLLAKAFVERSDAIDSLTAGQGTTMWYAHRVVDASFFGGGLHKEQMGEDVPLITLVSEPRDLAAQDLPPAVPASAWAPGLEIEDAEPGKSIPILQQVEPSGPVILATEEYIVGRGDTYWSVAEATLGDGREWKALQELNIGREVAPHVTLREVDELRIGWSILVPLTHDAAADPSTSV